MGMTMSEKILARACGRSELKAGDVVSPDPALVILHDGYVETAYKQLSEIGYKRITNPERVMIITDHSVIHTTPRAIEQARNNRRIAAEWRVGQFFDAGRAGHGHIYPMESGDVRPGMFLFSYDMHCTNFGAIGAFALRAGTDIPVVLSTGTCWTVTPRTLRVDLHGQFAPGVHGRDLGYRLSSDLVTGAAGVEYDYRVIEFGGPGAERLSIAQRVALCNTLTEIGVCNVLFPPKSPHGAEHDESWVESDSDANFENRIRIDLEDLPPQVALPGGPEKAATIAEAEGRPIDHAYLGGCGSGMFEDFLIAAEMIGARSIAPNVRFFVVPGTNRIANEMSEKGLTKIFVDAGAILLPPGCGPCAGGVGGPLGPGEVSISTAATNGAGRMGAKDSDCYLGSPITVTAAALAGRIVDPRKASG